MKEQLRLLVELQKTELDVSSLKNKKVELPETKHALEEEMQEHEARFELEKERLEALKKEHRQQEANLISNADKIKRAKGRLIEVKTNKEYEATLKEIETIKEVSGRIEDEIIRLLDEVERLSQSIAAENDEIGTHRATFEEQAAGIEKELRSLDAHLEEKVRKRDVIREKIDSNLLKKYDLIKTRRNGKAVVAAWQEVCGGCHMNIPPQMYNDLRRSETLILCPHCSRILYWEDLSSDE